MKPYVIFDFDGTMVQSKQLAIQIFNDLSPKYGGRQIHSDEVERLSEMSIHDRLHTLNIPVYKLPALLFDAKKEYRNSIITLQLVEGIQSVLMSLKQNGYSLGLLSSNTESNIQSFLDLHQLHVFDFVHSASNLFGKHRAIAKMARKHRIDVNNSWYIGDELRDIQACRNIGMKIVAVTWGYDSIHLLKDADRICHSPRSLLQVMQEQSRQQL